MPADNASEPMGGNWTLWYAARLRLLHHDEEAEPRPVPVIQTAHVAPVAPLPVAPNKRPSRWESTSAVVTIEELVASCHSTPYVSTKAGAAAAEHKK